MPLRSSPGRWSPTLGRSHMLKYRYNQLQSKINGPPLLCGFALIVPILLFLLTTAQVSAHTQAARPNLSLQVDMGFQATYKEVYWVPVNVHITNNSTQFTGKLEVKVFTGSPRLRNITITSPWHFEQPVAILEKPQQEITIYAPFYLVNFDQLGLVAT